MSGANDRPSGAPATTSSGPIFVAQADALIDRLLNDATPGAQQLLAEATELATRFRSWQTERPPNDVRVASIQRLLDLNRRVMNHLMGSGQPDTSAAEPPKKGLLDKIFKR